MCGSELFIRLTKSQGHFKFRIRRHFSSSFRFLVWEAYAMKTSGVRSLRRRKMCGSIAHGAHTLQKTKTIKLTTCKMLKMTQKCQYRQRLCDRAQIWKNSRFRSWQQLYVSISNVLTSAEFSSTKWATADRHEESKAIFQKNCKLHALLDIAYRAQ